MYSIVTLYRNLIKNFYSINDNILYYFFINSDTILCRKLNYILNNMKLKHSN